MKIVLCNVFVLLSAFAATTDLASAAPAGHKNPVDLQGDGPSATSSVDHPVARLRNLKQKKGKKNKNGKGKKDKKQKGGDDAVAAAARSGLSILDVVKDPDGEKCNQDYKAGFSFPCKDLTYPNCVGFTQGKKWGECYSRPPLPLLPEDPNKPECSWDHGSNAGVMCPDSNYPDCAGRNQGDNKMGTCRSTTPLTVKEDPSGEKCNQDFAAGKSFPCKDAAYPNCEGFTQGKKWGKCFSRFPVEVLAEDPAEPECSWDHGSNAGVMCPDASFPDCAGRNQEAKKMGKCYAKTLPTVPFCDASAGLNIKCPHEHGDRIFKEVGFSVEQCQEKCEMTDGCEFYSYSFPGSGNGHEKECMGCTTDANKQTHHGFHLFGDHCIGKAPPVPKTFNRSPGDLCASGTGDPHMKTFDGLKYDCQGEGDYVLSKSLDSDFELQGRFEKVPGLSVTTHQGAAITTGFPDEPKVEVEYTKECALSYRIDNTVVDLENGADTGNDNVDFIASGNTRSFAFDSGFTLKVMLRAWRGDCLLNVYLCIPETVGDENIVGIFGSPDGDSSNDFMGRDGTPSGTAVTTKKQRHNHCVETWCVPTADANLFATPIANDACEVPFDEEFEKLVENADPEIVTACGGAVACIVDTVAADGDIEEGLRTLADEEEDPEPPTVEEVVPPVNPQLAPPKEEEEEEEKEEQEIGAKSFTPTTKTGSGSGDPHFKTWSGEKYDYHGECDLVLVDDPSFNNGQGLRIHIRTTRVKYFSYIEKAAIQIGDEVLEFDNDVENFLINGLKVEANRQHHKTMLGGFVVRRDKKSLSIRLQDDKTAEARRAGKVAKIDLHTRKNGFPAIIVDAGHTDTFKGSLGLLGDWATGRKLARDGQTEIEVDSVNAEAFALEWQVLDTDPVLFKDARFPQYPQVCTPPSERVTTRIGMEAAMKEAEKACAHWAVDKDDCIFDVLATRDVLVAEEGHIVHLE